MAGTGSYYIVCIEYTLHYTVTSLILTTSFGLEVCNQYEIVATVSRIDSEMLLRILEGDG
jgi:hypothetical protein